MYGKTSPIPSPPLSPTSSVASDATSSSRQQERHSATVSRQQERHSATAKRHKYLRRIFKFRQMDFEYAFWQMLYLLMAPQKVYRNFAYRKQTKDQWARDDPAFLVLLSFWLFVSSVGFSFALHLGFIGFFKFLIWVVFIDCIGVGLLIASLFWFLANRYLIVQPPRGQDVEWGYAFDVHLNAFFPLLMILHFFQLPLLKLICDQHAWLPFTVLGNTFWLFAIGYYIYITFLGYSSLPFLRKTDILLFPLSGLFIVYLFSTIFNFNLTYLLCSFYTFRVL